MTASRMGLILLSSWLFALRARLLARTFAAQLSDFLGSLSNVGVPHN